MTTTRRQYDGSFKQEAIRLCESSGKSVAQIEADLDITPGLLRKWRRHHRLQGTQAFPGTGHQPVQDAELRRLQRENEILRQEREVLKKVLRLFSRDEG
jgi:transposase